LQKLENIDGKIDRLSKIVSTLATHPAKITELPSWTVLFKSAALLSVYLLFYNVEK